MSGRLLERRRKHAYPADDVIVIGEVGFALLAAKDFAAVEVDVVGESHRGILMVGCWLLDGRLEAWSGGFIGGRRVLGGG